MEDADHAEWVRQEVHRVRPYALTGGRTRPRYRMRLESHLVTGPEAPPEGLSPEGATVLALCAAGPVSVVEIAGRLQQPALAVRILLSDLIDAGLVKLLVPQGGPVHQNPQLLEAVLAGLQHRFGAHHAAS
ncbi:DUF742 domain-containing protein [Streptomyces sp. SID1121]|uniref:DUF742 domain-containing protein n=1 Tax=Streptomyces sp. SID1121 TaxID=3425888 RepID=UPI00405767BD